MYGQENDLTIAAPDGLDDTFDKLRAGYGAPNVIGRG
jgi:hypothetical protein